MLYDILFILCTLSITVTVFRCEYLFVAGVYIMSKSSGIMKIDSPGKLGPGLNIDQDVIRKQILAAKQVLYGILISVIKWNILEFIQCLLTNEFVLEENGRS